MNRIILVLLIAALAFAGGSPHVPRVHADTSDELLAYVREAYFNLLSLDSFTGNSDQLYQVTANLETYRVTLEFTYKAAVTSEVTPKDVFRGHAAFDVTMTNNMEPDATNVTMEMFIDGSTVYALIGGGNLPQGGQAGKIAPGWVNTDLLGDDASPAYQGLNEPTFFQLYGLNYLFEPGAVNTVSELEPMTIDGQKMRVIEVGYTASNLEASGVLEDMIEVFNGQAMGFTEEMTRQMLTGGSVYLFTVWIGEDDHLPHQFADYIEIESSINYQGATTKIAATMATATNLTGINEPITLTPPEVE